MVKPRQKAVISCRVRECLLFFGEFLEFWGQNRRFREQTRLFYPPDDKSI